jgi:hypothetical protein
METTFGDAALAVIDARMTHAAAHHRAASVALRIVIFVFRPFVSARFEM